ncbi:MAG TPA: hypothetical protein VMT57_02530 [Candidatus Thermoplasmatota archaeon]|nr:hypothetical protein [Candidatus Thermoplasmatota archaeon]
MDPFYREFELIKPVSEYFLRQGYRILEEVPIGYCRADLVAFKGDEVVAVELKLQYSQKAIIQVKNYQLAADFVYVALPLMKSFSMLRKKEHLLRNEGIGVLLVNEKTCAVEKFIDAEQSKRKFASLTIGEVQRRRNHRTQRFKIY